MSCQNHWLDSSCSTTREYTPHDPEIVGNGWIKCFILLFPSVLKRLIVVSLKELQHYWEKGTKQAVLPWAKPAKIALGGFKREKMLC